MTKDDAIAILSRQKDKLSDENHVNDEIWVFQTATAIQKFFGEDSEQYSFISQFSFKVTYSSMYDYDDESMKRDLANKRRQAIEFMDSCIETIKDFDLYEPPKQNFLNRLGNKSLGGLLILGLTAIGTIAFLLGEHTSNLERIEIRKELKDIQDSLSLVFPIINDVTNDIPHPHTDENNQAKNDSTHTAN